MEDAKTERIITPMSPDLLERIDDWRYAQHIATRAEAMRQLLEAGLKVLATRKPTRKG